MGVYMKSWEKHRFWRLQINFDPKLNIIYYIYELEKVTTFSEPQFTHL